MFGNGRMTACFAALVLVGLAALAGTAAADQVTMKNGDRISGNLINMENGLLVLQTSYAGELRIKWEEVAGLASDEDLAFKCRDGLVTGKAATDPKGVLINTGSDEARLVLSEVQAITHPDGGKLSVKGSVNVGAWSNRGNTHQDRYDLTADLRLAWGDIHRVDIYMESHYSEYRSVTNQDNSLYLLEYDRIISKEAYVYALAQASRDEFRDIKLRAALGGGVGYQVIATPRTDLSLETGPNLVYDDGYISGQSEYLAWRFAIDLYYWLWPEVAQVYLNSWCYVRVDDYEEYFLNTYTGVKFPLGRGFSIKMQYNYKYDDNPEPGKEKYDSCTMLLIGYAW